MLVFRFTSPVLAVATASALIFSLAACGSDSDGLAAPVPVRVTQVAAAGSLAAGVPESDAMSTDRGMWWFGGYEYQVGEGLNALPADSTGYRFAPTSEVSETTVRNLAVALGISDAPVQNPNPQIYDHAWTVGPTDGSAPSLTVINDPQATWYYSGAWAMDSIDAGTSGSISEPRDPDQPASDQPASDQDDSGGPDQISEWEPPTPPEGILTASEAREEAARLLTAIGQDLANFELEVWADEWYASVTAWPELGGRRSPMTWNFGFGEQGALQWAGGFLASPVATGPFPLVGLDEALERLIDQHTGWGAAVAMPAPDDTVSNEEIPEPEKELAILVQVEADLWWAMDADGSVWLLPAYRFIDSEGREHMVAAVTDEFLIIEPQVAIAEPLPAPDISVVGPGSQEEAEVMEELFNWASKELVGLELQAATDIAISRDAILRVARRDGEDQMLTMDYVFNRINIATETQTGDGSGPERIVEILFPG